MHGCSLCRVDEQHPHDAEDQAENREQQPGADANDRDRTAEGRDLRAEAHDHVSEARDARADARDERARNREEAAATVDPGAAADRAGALRDRQGGASDRIQAADDRDASSADRVLSAQDRTRSSIDELTAVYHRDAGLAELRRDIARAKRTKRPFVLAFVDVDNLKATNDTLGHPAGDRRLRETAASIRNRLRFYDLIIRYGGDEFVCGLVDVNMVTAAKRFSLVNEELSAKQQPRVTAGLAELRLDESVENLIARADDAMYNERRRRRSADA